MRTDITASTVGPYSIRVSFICRCDKHFEVQVFRNRLFFVPIGSETNPKVIVKWLEGGQGAMRVDVLCPYCRTGCTYRGFNGFGKFVSSD